MKNFEVLIHPLIEQKLSLLRNKITDNHQFRNLLSEITFLMVYEVTRTFKLKKETVETPLAITECNVLDEKIAIIPVLRAGLGMVEGILKLIPTAKVGHIGLYRDDETLKPQEYYCKLPLQIDNMKVFLIDPMLATGHTISHAINMLKKNNVDEKDITFVSIVASPEGVEYLQNSHPQIKIFSAALDEKLDEHGYIVPGLGDCGDRIFGTN
jgi:uracil phosphoribosyltransferase